MLKVYDYFKFMHFNTRFNFKTNVLIIFQVILRENISGLSSADLLRTIPSLSRGLPEEPSLSILP